MVRFGRLSLLCALTALTSWAQTANQVVVPAGSVWTYLNEEQPPTADWKEINYPQSGWPTGRAQLGYGDGDEQTVTRASSPPHPATAYFRHSFLASTNLPVTKVRLLRDDGAVVYINGREVLRDNMPDGPITPTTLAANTTGPETENQFREFSIAPVSLLQTTNVIAVEVHQANVASSDLGFDLELIVGIPEPQLPVIAIRAIQASTSEPLPTALVVPGRFQVNRTNDDLTLPLRVDLAYEGTASAADYEPLPSSVSIPAGEASAAFNVLAKSDDLIEGTEVVIAKIVRRDSLDPVTGNRPYSINPERARAEVRIADEDTPPLPVVSLLTVVSQTKEAGPNEDVAGALFRLRRTGGTDRTLSVLLRYEGTAAPETDYNRLPQTVTFAPGASETNLQVFAHDDNLVEGTETVIANLIYPPDAALLPGYIIDPNANSGTIRILDNDSAPSATLRITEPAEGSVYRPGVPIEITAIAIDPLGYIPRVELFADGNSIGVSEIAFLVPPEPGTPITHTITWNNAPAGEHLIVARARDSRGNAITSPEIKIIVAPDDLRVFVSVTAPDPVATELPLALSSIDPAIFEITRTGGTNLELTVFFTLHGTAEEGVDYRSVDHRAVFPPGARTVRVSINPITDDSPNQERMETVGIRLEPSADNRPIPIYEVTPGGGEAGAVIFEREPSTAFANMAFVFPDENARFELNRDVTLMVAAFHRSLDITHVDFLLDGEKIGTSDIVVPPDEPGGLFFHRFEWKAAPAGQHQLKAVGSSPGQLIMETLPLPILVGGDPTIPLVTLRTVRRTTTEGSPNNSTGLFEFARYGPTNNSLAIYFEVSGKATPGHDYLPLITPITIPAGRTTQQMAVTAIDDALAEEDESVMVRIVPAPTGADPYIVSIQTDRGLVDILDNEPTNTTARIEITRPVNGQQFAPGAPIQIDAVATDPNGYIPRLEFYASERLIGVSEIVFFRAPDPGTPIHHSIVWSNSPAGEHILSARGIDSAGRQITSNPVRITVRDGTNSPPRVTITSPRDGAVFEPGKPIFVGATAIDDNGPVPQFDLYAGDRLLWKTNGTALAFMWSNAPAGEHTLRAIAVDALGATGRATIRILVRGSSSAFVERDLPSNYVPGIPFEVLLTANPPAGSQAWAVEDQPPRGWTLGRISHDGVYDAATGKVKFGHFSDAQARRLTYLLTPSANASGQYEFSGNSSVDGESFPIAGDRLITGGASEHHPADANRDKRIVVVELTAYAAAWKSGNSSNAIPLGYVTRAAMIWRNGETYHFVPTNVAPACWVPDSAVLRPLAATESGAVRSCAAQVTPGAAFEVTIAVQPPSGSSASAVEERVPAGWIPANISHEGTFDAEGSVIRWGVFLDGTARTLRYSLTPPAGVTSAAQFHGDVSFDGGQERIAGSERVFAADASVAFGLTHCERRGDGSIQLKLSGASGQLCVLEVSADLQAWTVISEIFLPDGELTFVEDEAGGGSRRFYRLRVR